LPAEILQSIVGERHLLQLLRAALERQRAGVAGGDTAAIELASQAVASAALTLDAARRRREELMNVVSHGTPIRLDALEAYTGNIPGLAEARAALRNEAESVVADLSLTQDVLQGAMRAGNAYLQSLFASVAEASNSYSGPLATSGASASGGYLVNRTA
jgi:hypothetical protein